MNKLLPCAILIAFAPLCQAAEQETTATVAPRENRFLNWEHTLTTRTSESKHPVAKFKIYNNWTPTQHRFLVKYNVLGLGSQATALSERYGGTFSMPNFDPERILNKIASYHHGTFGVVERLNDDKFIAYSSEADSYFIEPRQALMKRLRFDPWKKIAPELSKEAPPTLTPAQRKRLGREVRSLMRPLLKDVFRSYFRAIPNTRTFNVAGEKIEARGYRMTMLFNAGARSESNEWMRVSMEWWLAPQAPGDEVLHSYGARYISDLGQLNGLTSSMWMNETLPIMWEIMPQEVHQALATLMPTGLPLDFNGQSAFRMSGAPVYAGLTLAAPPTPRYKRCPKCGEAHIPVPGQTVANTVRVEAQLNKRDTRTLDQRVFSAPPEYKKESIQPVLEQWDQGMEMIQSVFDKDLRLSDASALPSSRGSNALQANARIASVCSESTLAASAPRYSWSAMKNYLRAAGQFSR